MKTQATNHRGAVAIAIPLAWGVWVTLTKSLALFR